MLSDNANPTLLLREPHSLTMTFLWKQAKWWPWSRRAGGPQYREDAVWAGQAGLGCLLSVLAHPSPWLLESHKWAHHASRSLQQPLHLPGILYPASATVSILKFTPQTESPPHVPPPPPSAFLGTQAFSNESQFANPQGAKRSWSPNKCLTL